MRAKIAGPPLQILLATAVFVSWSQLATAVLPLATAVQNQWKMFPAIFERDFSAIDHLCLCYFFHEKLFQWIFGDFVGLIYDEEIHDLNLL